MAARSPRATSTLCSTTRRCSRLISAGAPLMPEGPLLALQDVVTYYGPIQALKGITLEVGESELVCLLGGNASGKSTTMKTVLGVVRPRRGTVTFAGERIDGLATQQIVRRG